jgi:SAM-dependent methyltransferase
MMEGYTPATYGDRIADQYDSLYESMFDVEGAVDFIAQLAGSEPALELGIGTGRVAIPLARRGVDVHGVDTSEAMVARLRAKAPDLDLPVRMGDFGAVDLGGPYSVIFVVFNTFFALLSQKAQVEAFRRIAAALADDGVFVIEAFVPDPGRWDGHQRVSSDGVSIDGARLEVSRHDPVDQRVESQTMTISAEGIRFSPVSLRYAWPSELDLMAQIATLRLRERWSNWTRSPFTSDSRSHISVYEKGGSTVAS